MRKANNQKKGGANPKMKKFARIMDYLEAHHKKVWDIIDNLAMHGNLTPRRGGAVTFLLPDAALIKEIEKIIESDEPEKATDIVLSLIISDLFEKPEDFSEKQDDVPNLLGKKIVVKSVSPSKIVIEDGELTLDTKFRPFSRQGNSKRGNMAVWNLKGKVEYEKAPVATMKYLKGAKKGSSQFTRGGGEDQNELLFIKRRILHDKISSVENNKKSSDGNKYCPILNAVTRVLRVFGNRNDPTFYEDYRRAKCLLTMCPVIDFYLLFCNPLVFPVERVLAAYKKGLDQDRNVDTYKELCNTYDHPAFSSDPALLFRAEGVSMANESRDNIRNSFLSRVSKETVNRIIKVYQEVDSTNVIDGQGPLYCKGLAEVFSSNKGLHLLIDEVAHMIYVYLNDEVKSAPNQKEKAKRLSDLFSIIHECYGDLTNPTKKTKLDKPESYGFSFDNQALYQCVVSFWKSWGLHMPCNSSHEFEDRIVTGGDEDPYSKDLLDVDKHIMDDLTSFDNCPICVSESSIAEVKAYLREYGELPGDLKN